MTSPWHGGGRRFKSGRAHLTWEDFEEIMVKKHSYENGRYSMEYKWINYDIAYDSVFNLKLAKIFKDKLMIFLSDLEKEIGNIPNIIKDKEQLKGKMILALTLDLKEMKEQFLKRYENSMKKSYVKWENEEAWSLLLKGNNKGLIFNESLTFIWLWHKHWC